LKSRNGKKNDLLPAKVRVSCVDYDVIYPYTFSHASNSQKKLLGLHSPSEARIYMAEKYNGDIIPTGTLHRIFLHELIHAIDTIYVGGIVASLKDTEGMIDGIAEGFYQIICDNNLDFCNNWKMPSKVKVGGVSYKVEKDYIFRDTEEEVSATLDHIHKLMFIGKQYQGTNYPSIILKMNLVHCMLCAVVNAYCKADWGNMQSENQSSLSWGLLDVLVSNDLCSLFIKYKDR
jgi:hypothetical protein